MTHNQFLPSELREKQFAKKIDKYLEKCRHSMRATKGFVVCCIYCKNSLDEIQTDIANFAYQQGLKDGEGKM